MEALQISKESQLGTFIQSLVLDFYHKAPAYDKVRPQIKCDTKQWTVLAAFLMEREGIFQIISLATGTKSIPRSAMNEEGYVLNDCHAEVLARRSLLKYLISEMAKSKQGEISSIFAFGNGILKLKDSIRFHLYISEPPCGDSSLLHQSDQDQFSHWTGAKSVGEKASSKVVGITRTKCGRSDIREDQRSESMSCSDKILKWNALGFQGALLDRILQTPIYLTSITIESPYFMLDSNIEVLKRGLCSHHRLKDASKLIFVNEPILCLVQPRFLYGRYLKPDQISQPCGHSMTWSVDNSKVQMIIGNFGVKQGANVKNKKLLKNFRSDICDHEFFKAVQQFAGDEGKTYFEAKALAKEYQHKKQILQEILVGGWTDKEFKAKYQQFKLE
ncbi:hypothetical protein FGO68_gene6626 [Halteria grandinella]|uniref:A to I editase domain-containing protein n=1 Tax=Halteria grandinella TaxID=5974 RepID=A0A8J8NLB5_HALGN|nr:hypothetical protein FGO68_gene6626 [Halteria grandinella]